MKLAIFPSFGQVGVMPLAYTHQLIDRVNEEQDRCIARRLRHDRRVLGAARGNLRRWMARDGKQARPVFLEWQRILQVLSPREIADFLVSNTPRSRRLRQSSPFAGVLSEAERSAIRRKHEKTRI